MGILLLESATCTCGWVGRNLLLLFPVGLTQERFAPYASAELNPIARLRLGTYCTLSKHKNLVSEALALTARQCKDKRNGGSLANRQGKEATSCWPRVVLSWESVVLLHSSDNAVVSVCTPIDGQNKCFHGCLCDSARFWPLSWLPCMAAHAACKLVLLVGEAAPQLCR